MPLKIGGKDVNKLSGPVSIYILKPSPKYLKEFPYAPIYILFGDHHFSANNFCVNADEEEKGNYKFFSENFLQLLSDAVGDERIDFYTEGGPFHLKDFDISSKLTANTPMHDIWIMFKKCYYNTRMKEMQTFDIQTYKKLKNIRWQSGDIRFFPKEKYNLEEFIRKFLNNKELKDLNKDDFEKHVSRFVEILKNDIYIHISHDKIANDIEITEQEFIDKHIKENGLIKKQIDKSPKKNYIEEECVKYTKMVYKNSLNGYMKGFINFTNFHNTIKTLFSHDYDSDEMNKVISFIYANYRNGKLQTYSYILTYIYSLRPDLYILARSFKLMTQYSEQSNVPPDNKHPLINICYYGNFHIKNINSYLISENYSSLYSKDIDDTDDVKLETDKTNRCIELNTETNLNILIDELKKSRDDYKKTCPIKEIPNKKYSYWETFINPIFGIKN
jgi:hypothetical protein